MEVSVITLIFGCILLAVGILGGGFQLKEMNVPKVGKVSRSISAFLGIFFILFGIGLENPEPPEPPVPSPLPTSPTPSPEPPTPNYSGENTYSYWMRWKSLADEVVELVEPLTKSYSVDNSQKLSQIFTALADLLAKEPIEGVDQRLLNLVSEVIPLYRQRARLFQEQANILQRYIQFQQENNSSDKAIEAIIRGLLNEDLLTVPKEMIEEQQQFENEWQYNINSLNQVNNTITDLAAKRDGLRIQLSSTYKTDFHPF